MELAHYIIFHPDRYGKTEVRQKVLVTASALVKSKLKRNWSGSIYVDQINVGNEDPFVLVEPWLYSFCHASQLRRNNPLNKVDAGSILIFVSGDFVNEGRLVVDTVFIVDEVHKWGAFNKILSRPTLPEFYKEIYNKDCDLWNRHFKYPFEGQHEGVTHTYSARLWNNENSLFSFLPVNDQGERVGFNLHDLEQTLSDKIRDNVVGKIPVRFSTEEITTIINRIDELASVKVIRDIKLKEEIPSVPKEKCSIC